MIVYDFEKNIVKCFTKEKLWRKLVLFVEKWRSSRSLGRLYKVSSSRQTFDQSQMLLKNHHHTHRYYAASGAYS